MTFREWLRRLLLGQPPKPTTPSLDKSRLSQRQIEIADRLAQMQGVTRDEVLAEAYRRADRTLAARRR